MFLLSLATSLVKRAVITALFFLYCCAVICVFILGVIIRWHHNKIGRRACCCLQHGRQILLHPAFSFMSPVTSAACWRRCTVLRSAAELASCYVIKSSSNQRTNFVTNSVGLGVCDWPTPRFSKPETRNAKPKTRGWIVNAPALGFMARHQKSWVERTNCCLLSANHKPTPPKHNSFYAQQAHHRRVKKTPPRVGRNGFSLVHQMQPQTDRYSNTSSRDEILHGSLGC